MGILRPLLICVVRQDEDRGDGDEDPEGRINLEATANQEARDVERSVLFLLAKEESGDEEAAQDEKQVHANPAARGRKLRDAVEEGACFNRGRRHVSPEDEQDGDGAQYIHLLEPIHAQQC